MSGVTEDSYYEIRIKGHLDIHWASWFDGMTLTSLANGETVLSGMLPDQSALQEILLGLWHVNAATVVNDVAQALELRVVHGQVRRCHRHILILGPDDSW